MQITLLIDGKEKTFTNDFVKARVFRNALKLNEKLRGFENNVTPELFDEMVEFVVAVFDRQFTIDEFYDGIEVSKMINEIMRIFNEVLNVGGLEVKSEGK